MDLFAGGVDMNVHGVLCDLGRIFHMLGAFFSYVTDPFANGWDSEGFCLYG